MRTPENEANEVGGAIDPRFGMKIKERRIERGMSIRETAEMAGCSAAQLTRLENGQRRIRSQQLLRSLSRALIIPYDELCELAGPAFQQKDGSLMQQAFPSIKNDVQEEALKEFAAIISASTITAEQKDKLLEMCTAYVQYCDSQNSRNGSDKKN